jgi:putative ATP-dependent endonuclease of OLD family
VSWTEDEVADLERYLEVTRGEVLFARGVVLVEGNAEEYIIPILANLLGHDFDELGISVCSIAGTHFNRISNCLDQKHSIFRMSF